MDEKRSNYQAPVTETIAVEMERLILDVSMYEDATRNDYGMQQTEEWY